MTALGASGALAIARETTFGTSVTPTRWYPFLTEKVDPGQEFAVSQALRSDTGRVRLGSARIPTIKNSSASFTAEINNKGFGLLLRAMFGNYATTQPNVGTDPTVYDHTFTPNVTLGNEIFTIETGWLDDASNQYAKKAVSAMVNTAEISVTPSTIAECALDFLAQTVTTATSRTSASYISGLTPLGGGAATVTLGGVNAEAVSCKVKVDNQLDGSRYYLGGAGQRKQPIPGILNLTAELDGDFKDWTNYNRVINNTYASLVVTLPGAVISHAYTYQLQITMNVATVGDAPTLDGPGRISQPLKLEAYDDGTGVGSAITVVYRTTDATP